MALFPNNQKLCIPWPVALLVGVMQIQAACAEEAKSVSPAESTATQIDQNVGMILRQIDLGPFRIQQIRPTRNETVEVRFELILVLPEATTKREVARLENWKHRLRDQAITSVRLAETKDFSEPELRRLQRLILLRINRILKFTRIQGLFFTRFEFSVN